MTEQGQDEAKNSSWATTQPDGEVKKEITATEVQIASFSQLRDINAKSAKTIEQNEKIIVLLEKIASQQLMAGTMNVPTTPKLSPIEKVKKTIVDEDKEKQLTDKLIITEDPEFVIIKTTGYLSAGFNILGAAMRKLNAEYNNLDKKNTYWKVSKAKLA